MSVAADHAAHEMPRRGKWLRRNAPLALMLLVIIGLTRADLQASATDIGLIALILAGPLVVFLTQERRRFLWMVLNAGMICVSIVGLLVLMHRPGVAGAASSAIWAVVFGLWAAAWFVTHELSLQSNRAASLLAPALFGATILFLWEAVVVGFGVPFVLMPAPSAIGARFANSLPTLARDFVQTFLKSVIPGWLLGSVLGVIVALLCDRIPFLRRGLLPLGHVASALPIIGIAPIMVMWFGFDWPSKVAVVTVMTFFPMLVNTVAGLAATGALERDLMRTYGSDWATTLVKLRLPFAMPFIFNALKINSTLALIGAIVAEFFGTPIVGMGFRISTEAGRLGLDMVWAEIALAALAGSAFYGALALAERQMTFWHPSFRMRD